MLSCKERPQRKPRNPHRRPMQEAGTDRAQQALKQATAWRGTDQALLGTDAAAAPADRLWLLQPGGTVHRPLAAALRAQSTPHLSHTTPPRDRVSDEAMRIRT